MTSAGRTGRDLALLAGLVTLIALAARRAQRLELDVENRSMRSATGAAARAEDRRDELFGQDATLVLLLEPGARPAAPGTDPTPVDERTREREASAWADALRERPETAHLVLLPDEAAGERLLALTLAADAGGRIARPLESLSAFARASGPSWARVRISGPPAGEAAIAAALQREQQRIVPLVGATLFLLLLVVYRGPSLALGALIPAVGGIALTGAAQEALGYAVNPVTSLLPPVLLAVGVAGSVHLVDAYLDLRRRGIDPRPASRGALREVLVPALGCAATTMIGFLALLVSPIPAVERFGMLAAIGVGATAALSLLFLPTWLRTFSRSQRLRRRAAEDGPWRRWSLALARRLGRAPLAVTLAAGIVAVVLGLAWTRMEVDTDPLRILPATHPFRIDTERIGARLGGTETFDLLLAPEVPGGQVPLLFLQTQLCRLDGVVQPAGLPRRASDGTALVSLLLAPSGTSAREELFAEAEETAREAGWTAAHATGMAVRTARDSGAIVRGEVRGLLATFLALGPCMWIGLRSLRSTVLGLAANTLPCLALHGGLALAGRPLSVASAMIGSVVLGLVVDQAIYFLHGFQRGVGRHSPRVAVARTLRHSGRAMTVTSLVLALGFLAGVAGQLTTTREFGILAAGSILAAWIANVLLLPAFLLTARSRARARSTDPSP